MPRPVTRQYDDVFGRHAGELPVSFLRALAKRESNMDPSESGGSYWGILQVGWRDRTDDRGRKRESVLSSYNRRHGTSFVPGDLFSPEVCTRVAAELLNRIVASYRRNHTSRNLQTDWGNPEFVRLVVAGWNSGWSEGGGVGKVASYLERHGIEVTHENVFRHARAAGATKHLRAGMEGAERKKRWQRSVAALYFEEGGGDLLSPRTIASIVASFLVLGFARYRGA